MTILFAVPNKFDIFVFYINHTKQKSRHDLTDKQAILYRAHHSIYQQKYHQGSYRTTPCRQKLHTPATESAHNTDDSVIQHNIHQQGTGRILFPPYTRGFVPLCVRTAETIHAKLSFHRRNTGHCRL